MKAIVFDRHGPSSVLRYADVPVPRVGPGEALVAVRAVAVNHGPDVETRRKGFGMGGVELPHIGGRRPRRRGRRGRAGRRRLRARRPGRGLPGDRLRFVRLLRARCAGELLPQLAAVRRADAGRAGAVPHRAGQAARAAARQRLLRGRGGAWRRVHHDLPRAGRARGASGRRVAARDGRRRWLRGRGGSARQAPRRRGHRAHRSGVEAAAAARPRRRPRARLPRRRLGRPGPRHHPRARRGRRVRQRRRRHSGVQPAVPRPGREAHLLGRYHRVGRARSTSATSTATSTACASTCRAPKPTCSSSSPSSPTAGWSR